MTRLDRLGSQYSGGMRLKPLVERMRIIAVHVRLVVDGERDVVGRRAELRDLLLLAGLLRAELVAGESKDNEALVLILLVEGLKAGVLRGVLGSEEDLIRLSRATRNQKLSVRHSVRRHSR